MNLFSNQYLFHISEEPDIAQFEPRPDKFGNNKIWAISATRVQNYLFPRDCPRIAIWANESTDNVDRQKLSNSNYVIAIEHRWLTRLKNTKLYAYTFDSNGFDSEDENAGYFTATSSQTPIKKLEIGNPIEQLNKLGAHLETPTELHKFREMVLASTFAYSMIRMRNAVPIQSTPT